MSRSLSGTRVTDAHVHFFSPNFIANYAKLGKDRLGSANSVDALLDLMGWKMGDTDPTVLADRWVREMDDKRIDRMVLVTSWAGDEEATAAAVASNPDRFAGYVMINPLVEGSSERAGRAINDLGLHAVSLFPAMMGFRASDDVVYPVYHAALKAGAPVFIHFGILKVGIRDKLGLVSNFDLR